MVLCWVGGIGEWGVGVGIGSQDRGLVFVGRGGGMLVG